MSKRTLAEIAEAEGYENGRFALRRLAENTARLEEWIRDMKRGIQHEDLATLTGAEARDLVVKEALALAKEERDWAPFFHATKKAVDATVSGNPDAPLKVQIVRFSDPSPE